MRPPGERGPASAEAMFAVDATQRIVAWNREASHLFGHDNGSIIGVPCFELVGALDRKGHRFCREDCPVIAAARAGDPSPTLRLHARTRSGEVVPVDVSTIVLYSEDEVSAVIHLCRPGSEGTRVLPEPVGQPRLTRREQEVLGCLCRAFSTAEIATELEISETTVRNHVQHVLDKLAAHSRTEVVALAYKDHLVQ